MIRDLEENYDRTLCASRCVLWTRRRVCEGPPGLRSSLTGRSSVDIRVLQEWQLIHDVPATRGPRP
jgi:hypothetical protein